jgi:hypothetical protein
MREHVGLKHGVDTYYLTAKDRACHTRMLEKRCRRAKAKYKRCQETGMSVEKPNHQAKKRLTPPLFLVSKTAPSYAHLVSSIH